MRPLFESRGNRFGKFEESSLQSSCKKKSFEVAYAILRVARAGKSLSFAHRLEDAAFRLVEDATRVENALFVIEDLDVIDSLLYLGVEAGFIHQANANLIFSETAKLNSAIAELVDKSATPKRVEIEDLFVKHDIGEDAVTPFYPTEQINDRDFFPEEFQLNKDKGPAAQNEQKDALPSEKVAIRQSAILAAIRQLPNCSLRMIQDMFPSVSERTLRYDLEHLVTEGAIDRVGGSTGPGIFYQIREAEESRGYPHLSA